MRFSSEQVLIVIHITLQKLNILRFHFHNVKMLMEQVSKKWIQKNLQDLLCLADFRIFILK